MSGECDKCGEHCLDCECGFSQIIWPENTKEEDKQWMKFYLKRHALEKFRVCVIYTPDCGCEIEQFVVLDRYPMSKKIHYLCEKCKKGVLSEISDPIRFHQPWDGKDFELKDLLNMHISNHQTNHQYEFLKAYQYEAEKLFQKK